MQNLHRFDEGDYQQIRTIYFLGDTGLISFSVTLKLLQHSGQKTDIDDGGGVRGHSMYDEECTHTNHGAASGVGNGMPGTHDQRGQSP